MPVTDTITTFYSFTARTQIKSAEMNNNFGAFRGHLIAVDGSLSALAVTNSYDLGSSSRYWRAGYITQVNCSTLAASSVNTTTLTASSVQTTTLTTSSLISTTATVTTLNHAGGTASRVAVLDASKNFASSTVTSTELEIIAGSTAKASFNPIVMGTSSTGTGTYSTQVGRSARFGPIVFFHIHVQISAHTGSGNMKLGGLPVACANVTNGQIACSVGYANNLALTAGNNLKAYVIPNSTEIDLTQSPTGTQAESAVPLDTSFQLILSGWYFAV